MKKSIHLLFLISALLLFDAVHLRAQDYNTIFDNLLTKKYKADHPGATVLISKKGKVLYHKAFGLANLELNIPMKTDHVFEIGSITKQFTAVAILMLEEQGKLSVDDEITKFLPDYPTKGKKITIHHLLNHTSGIKSYTSMNLSEIAALDKTPTELIDYFKNEPMDFDPGTKWQYNNSGYIILGYIIEKLSHQTYEDFVEQNIFTPLQMTNSRYGHKYEIIKNRASGYQPSEQGYVNADYLSMTLPYAAGSLMSTVEDLDKWQKGLNTNVLLKNENLKKAFQNTKLNNGKPTYYGYGWTVNEINGTPTIEHGGGIFGYTSYRVYVPESDVNVVILTNSNGNAPTDICIQLASILINKPYGNNTTVNLENKDLKKLTGVYEFEDGASRVITLKENQLYSQRDGGQNFKIFPKSKSTFYFTDSFSEIEFIQSNSKIEAIFKNRINHSKGVKTDKPIPADKVVIQLPTSVLEQYVGTYEIKPGFDINIKLEGNQLIAQATGQPAFQIHPESENKFFIKEFAAALEFLKENDSVSKAILHQGGQQTPAKRKN